MTKNSRRLLLVDDDAVFAKVMARALQSRGFAVTVVHDVASAMQAAHDGADFAVVDLKIGRESGLALIPELRRVLPHARIVLLTGYASIATAVEAIKRGAHDYLPKPVDADAVVKVLLGDAADKVDESHEMSSSRLKRLEWEHIQRVLGECDGNVSEASRRLGLHRRTLQRKLVKRPVPEIPVD